MYNDMVKMAYDEICGFDKEAAFDRLKGKIRRGRADSYEDKAYNAETSYKLKALSGQRMNEANSGLASIKGDKYKSKFERMYDRINQYNAINDANVNHYKALTDAANDVLSEQANIKAEKAKNKADIKKLRNKKNMRYMEAAYAAANQSNSDLADIYREMQAAKSRNTMRNADITNEYNTLGHTYGYQGNRAADLALKANRAAGYADLAEARANAKAEAKAARKAEKQAEKAAAYYDEAQLAKEAAVEDYNEACAYEEAAIAILDELGYLD